MMALFAGNSSAHGTHGEPDHDPEKGKWVIKRTARTLAEPVTEELWLQHLTGERPLGIVPIREDSTCLWGSIDIDDYENDLTEVVQLVEERGLPLVPCRSKSGGLHLFMFLAVPQPAGQVLSTLRVIAASLGLAGSEIFPKQSQVLTERGDIGSWMVMPYFGGTFDGKLQMQVGLRAGGSEMTTSQFMAVAEHSRLSPEAFAELVATRHRPRTPGAQAKRANGAGREPSVPFGDGPPCLQHLAAQGVPRGGQNNTLMMMGIYFKKSHPADWREKLEVANSRFLDPPGSAEGLVQTIRSLERKEYDYTCKIEPMCSHCDSATCVTRRHGVGDGGNFPRITSMSKLDTEPPVWFVDVEDKRLEVSTDELQNYMKFHRVCMERLDRCYAILKQQTWLAAISSAMKDLILIEASADVGEGERFREALEEFLTNRQRGLHREDLFAGRPWEDPEDGRHYFRLADLQKFLVKEGFREISRVKIARRIEDLGGAQHFMNIRGFGGLSTWWVPGDAVRAPPDMPAPPMPEAKI